MPAPPTASPLPTTRPDVTDDATRRRFLQLIAAAGLLAGCGDEAGSAAPSPSASPATRTVDTPLGPVQVPVRAERVVALDYFWAIGTDLGVPMIARGGYVVPWKADVAAGVPAGDGTDGVADVEKILELRPDLILSTTYQVESIRAELRKIAPLVEVPDEFPLRWQDMTRLMAQACGLPDPGATLTAIQERARAVGVAAGVRGSRAAIVRPGDPGQFRVHTRGSFCGDLLSEVGFELQEFGGNSPTLSLERLGEVDADRIFLWTIGATGEDPAEVAARVASVTGSPLWASLPAVRAGRAHVVGEHWYGSDLEAVDLTLDDVAAALGGSASAAPTVSPTTAPTASGTPSPSASPSAPPS